MVSTITSLSLRVSSAKRETSSIKSALVINPSFASCLWLNLHNLLKFQGLCASHGFGQCRSARNRTLWRARLPCVDGASSRLLQDFEPAYDPSHKQQR